MGHLLFTMLLTLALVVSALRLPAWCQGLTDAQYVTLKTDMLTTNAAEFAEMVAARDDQLIADAYNAVASGDCWVWRTNLTLNEVYDTTSVDGTTWSTPILIARSQGERDAWRDVYAIRGRFNPSLLNARQGLADIFSGAPGLAQRTHLLALGRRKALRIEKLLASGACTTAAPSTMTYEGTVTVFDIAQILNGVKGQ